MKKILVLNGSPRKKGNTNTLIAQFVAGAKENNATIEEFFLHTLDLSYCTGCLRCNILKRCSISNDAWQEVSRKILNADILVFGSPIYFHHVSAQMKTLIDRFRSFVHVQITKDGLKHTPHHNWQKHFVLLLPLGSSSTSDALPVIDLFQFMINMLGEKNKLHVLTGTRLAVSQQLKKSQEELVALYKKLNIPVELAKKDSEKNKQLLNNCFNLGVRLSIDN